MLDVAIVGAGFSGLYMLHRARAAGLQAQIIERGGDVGGTWYWNRYPGARCDIESVDYCFSFSEELLRDWRWTERYAAQPEILRYLQHVADRFDLRRDIRLNTSVAAAAWDEERLAWTLTTEQGETVRARWCVLAVGNLSSIKRPDVPGLEDFAGDWHHTADWPEEGVNLAGRRVAVVGTGSTGIQAITEIAKQAEHLYVLQRTPNYSMPAMNRPLASRELDDIRATYRDRRALAERSHAGVPFPAPTRAALDTDEAERRRRYEAGWRRGGINALSSAFTDLFTDEDANRTAQDFARERIREIVHDARTAEALCPSHHIGTKRTCVDTGYFETFNRENVELVDLRHEPLMRITPRAIATTRRELELDVIVFAIGFDAMTGALLEIDVRGADGVRLRDAWAAGPRTYLGLAAAGFPNLFLVTGPGSPSVLSNMAVSIEQHVDWIADCLTHLRERGVHRIEATPQAEQGWVEHVAEVAAGTLYPAASSWYVGANIPGKPRVFMPYVGGVGTYRRECDEVAARGYEGFELAGARTEARA